MIVRHNVILIRVLRKLACAVCLLTLLLGSPGLLTTAQGEFDAVPGEFVDVAYHLPEIELDVRYFGQDNFVGQRIDGYLAERIFMTRVAADSLAMVQDELAQLKLGLKIFDGYRPQHAVDHFVRWALNLEDTRMKQRYYPEVDKSDLFSGGYIAARSGHSRGSTVDLTIISLETNEELDMGTGWDFFDPSSWPSSSEVNAKQRANRMLLKLIMLKHGFKPISTEWWHFTLEDEPFPDTYYDFTIR